MRLCNWMICIVTFLCLRIIQAQITQQSHVLKLVCLLAKTTATNKIESLYYSPQQVVRIMNITSCSHYLRGTYEIYNLNGETFISLLNYAFSFLILRQVQSDYESASSLVEIILTELVESVFRASHPVHSRVDSKIRSAYNLRGSINHHDVSEKSTTDGDASVDSIEYSDDGLHHHHDDDDYYYSGDDGDCSRISLPIAQYENITIEDKVAQIVDGMKNKNYYFGHVYYLLKPKPFYCNNLLLLPIYCCRYGHPFQYILRTPAVMVRTFPTH